MHTREHIGAQTYLACGAAALMLPATVVAGYLVVFFAVSIPAILLTVLTQIVGARPTQCALANGAGACVMCHNVSLCCYECIILPTDRMYILFLPNIENSSVTKHPGSPTRLLNIIVSVKAEHTVLS